MWGLVVSAGLLVTLLPVPSIGGPAVNSNAKPSQIKPWSCESKSGPLQVMRSKDVASNYGPYGNSWFQLTSLDLASSDWTKEFEMSQGFVGEREITRTITGDEGDIESNWNKRLYKPDSTTGLMPRGDTQINGAIMHGNTMYGIFDKHQPKLCAFDDVNLACVLDLSVPGTGEWLGNESHTASSDFDDLESHSDSWGSTAALIRDEMYLGKGFLNTHVTGLGTDSPTIVAGDMLKSKTFAVDGRTFADFTGITEISPDSFIVDGNGERNHFLIGLNDENILMVVRLNRDLTFGPHATVQLNPLYTTEEGVNIFREKGHHWGAAWTFNAAVSPQAMFGSNNGDGIYELLAGAVIPDDCWYDNSVDVDDPICATAKVTFAWRHASQEALVNDGLSCAEEQWDYCEDTRRLNQETGEWIIVPSSIDNCNICGGRGVDFKPSPSPDDICDCFGNVYDKCNICGGNDECACDNFDGLYNPGKCDAEATCFDKQVGSNSGYQCECQYPYLGKSLINSLEVDCVLATCGDMDGLGKPACDLNTEYCYYKETP